MRFFAKAIGETDPVYTDVTAARAAGYPDLPAPPTFLFAADLDAGVTEDMLASMGVPLRKVLHGEQHFTYARTVCAGETITVKSQITDIFDKKNGALEFIVKSSEARDERGGLVGTTRSVIVVRN